MSTECLTVVKRLQLSLEFPGLHAATFGDYRFLVKIDHIYSDTRRRPNGGRQGKIFKIDTSTLLQMAFPVLIKALVM